MMTKPATKKVKRTPFNKDEKGSLTIEAVFIMPLLLLFTIVLLAIGIATYQRTILNQQAFEWSERASYVWKDSNRHPVTGAFSYHSMDDIYDSLISEGLGFLSASFNNFNQAAIQLPQQTASGQSLAAAKLLRSSSTLSTAIEGQNRYFNRLIERELLADWTATGSNSTWITSPSSGSTHNARVSSYYTDPVEFLRTVNLVVEYSARLKEHFASPEQAVAKIKELLPQTTEKPLIDSEAKATAYLRQLIGASGTEFQTSLGKRIIDVFDSDGFAHEAKYNVNKSQFSLQIKKDVELMRTGQVKGVVWHFFYVQNRGKYDTTPAMLRELEQNGIVVVYHR